MRLRTRFTLLLGALAAGILLIAAALVFFYQDKYLARKTREYHANGLEQFAKACASSVRLKNGGEFLQYACDVAYSTGMAYGAFYSPDGKPVFHSGRAARAPVPNPSHLETVLKSENQAEFFDREPGTGRSVQLRARAVRENGRTLGVAALFYYPDVLRARRRVALRNGMRRFVWAALIAVLPILALSYYLARHLSQPMDILVRGARAVGKGNLEHRIRLRRSDEIGELAGEFNRMAEKLRELDRLKEEFMANITHELRSPAAAIAGFADMLLSGAAGRLSPKQEEWAETIKKSALRLTGMINNILDIAKLEAGLMKFSPEPVRVGDAVHEATALFEPLARQGNINLSARIDEGVPPALVDPESLQQVLINLLGNAVKFTPENGKVLVEVKGQKDGCIAISVSDTGPGIPEEALPKLFTKFFQAQAARAKGTGLGLAICKGIIESQGGRIWEASGKGGGAAFTFTLPAKQ